jgi:hypothetical protein
MTTRKPDAFDRYGEQLSERLNPILVKEVRQGLRTKVFWIFFSLLLFTCLSIALAVYASAHAFDLKSGLVAFGFFFATLGLVLFFVIPYTAYRSMSREAEEETWVLLTLTGLGPRKILGGKLQSFVVQGLLYASAAAPFLLFSYYLNGIDLPTIVVTAFVAVAYLVFLVSTSVSMATLADSRLVRGLLHFVLLGFLLWATSMGIAAGVGASEMARKIHDDGFLLGALTVALTLVSTGLLLFELAASRLSLVTENYARGPRAYLVLQWLCGIGAFLLGIHILKDNDVAVVGHVTACAYLMTVGLMVTSDLDGMAHIHTLKSKTWRILKPGAFRGFVLLILLVIVSSAIFIAISLNDSATSEKQMRLMLGAPAYMLMYVSFAHIVGRGISQSVHQVPAMVRVALIGLLVLGCGLPPIFGQLIDDVDHPIINILNPTIGLANLEKSGGWELVIFIWAIAFALTVWALTLLASKDKVPAAPTQATHASEEFAVP